MSEPWSNRWASFFALNRTVAIVLAAVLLFGLGEELWRSFLPAYLQDQSKDLAREATRVGGVEVRALWRIGFFVLWLNIFEGICYIGGGQFTARLGDRGSLIAFGLATIVGYAIFLVSPADAEWLTIVACLLILGWEPLSIPATFTTVGATVAGAKQGMAFAVQSIQKRLPKIMGPAIAGFVLDWAAQSAHTPEEGRIAGTHLLVGIALALGCGSILLQFYVMPRRKTVSDHTSAWTIVREFPPQLKSLLVAEMVTRWCDWLIREFVILYVVFVREASFTTAGLLITLQNVTALCTYLPVGRLTQTVGRQPFIGLTFIFFAAFPLVLWLVPDQWLWLAFIVYGLREIGEPARKALITSSIPEPVRAKGVGLYWGMRSLVLCWAGLVGAWLWLTVGPENLLLIASGVGALGILMFYRFAYSGSSLPTLIEKP